MRYDDCLLITAVQKNDLNRLKTLITKTNKHPYKPYSYLDDYGVAPIDGTYREETPLQIAVRYGHVNMVRYFMQEAPEAVRASVLKHFHQSENGETATYLAAQSNKLEMLKLLLPAAEADSSTDSKSETDTFRYYQPRSDGTTPLWIAAQNGHANVVDWLLSSKNPHQQAVLDTIDARWEKTGATALYQAAQNGHLSIVKRLLKKRSKKLSVFCLPKRHTFIRPLPH